MKVAAPRERDQIFISKATPGDDQFVLWLAPRLEAVGYKVFADILNLEPGDDWRSEITDTLQKRAFKMLLCCSDETLSKRGVNEEIAIATELEDHLSDPKFIIPLKIRGFQPRFGIARRQYVDFERGWAKGLANLLESLDKYQVPKTTGGVIQPQWHAYLRRRAAEVEMAPEVLTSNWLRIIGMPVTLKRLVLQNRASDALLRRLGNSFQFPLAKFGNGFLTFASPFELTGHFERVGPFRIEREFDILEFMEVGCCDEQIESRDAKSIMVNLLRQAWEKHCVREGFLAHTFSSGLSLHVSEGKLFLKQRVAWGRQGERRNSMLRGVARNKIWEYGVSVIPNLFPFPHMRLKGRILFSDIDERNMPMIIRNKNVQFRLRRSICSRWRNKTWHGRLMAFMELLAGDSPYIDLPVSSGDSIRLEAMPIQVTSPVTVLQTDRAGEDAEESDAMTLGNYYEDEDV